MKNELMLTEKEKKTLTVLKEMTSKHNSDVPSQFINFNAYFAKAKDVQELNSSIRKAISEAVARASAPTRVTTRKEELVKVSDELNVASSSSSAVKEKPAAPKQKASKTEIILGTAHYVPPPIPVVDHFAGLGQKARAHAVELRTNGVGNIMSGPTGKDKNFKQADLNELRTWVEAQRTKSAQQKWVTNVGWGSGPHKDRWQFKVTGFGTVATSTSAPTWHLWINEDLV